MKFEIPFEEKIYTDQMNLYFNKTWETNLKKNKERLIVSIPMILLGSLIVYLENNIGFIFIAFGIHYLINFFSYYSYFKKSKKTFFDSVETEKNDQLIANENSIWEFHDDYFKYIDYKCEIKLKWNAFQNKRVIEKNLFLDIDTKNNISYILGEIEVGTQEFQKIIELVKNKIN